MSRKWRLGSRNSAACSPRASGKRCRFGRCLGGASSLQISHPSADSTCTLVPPLLICYFGFSVFFSFWPRPLLISSPNGLPQPQSSSHGLWPSVLTSSHQPNSPVFIYELEHNLRMAVRLKRESINLRLYIHSPLSHLLFLRKVIKHPIPV